MIIIRPKANNGLLQPRLQDDDDDDEWQKCRFSTTSMRENISQAVG